MSTLLTTPEVDALKAKLKATWMAGDYDLFSRYLETDARVFYENLDVPSRCQLLDVACGSGQVALLAAHDGVYATGVDIAPNLIQKAQARAKAENLHARFVEGDAEALPFEDASFDVVTSLFGAMFAPRPELVARELLRVCSPGGTIAMGNWTPEGFIGQMFAVLKPFAPPPPPGALPATLWGSEEHVRELLGGRITDVRTRKQNLAVRSFHQPGDFVRYFKSHYGPIISVYKSLAEDQEKAKALDKALTDLADSFGDAHGDSPFQMEWEYLLFTARKAAA
jgi:ubiquinone/menaquinone biosynthesis C-methylase UbiE